MHQMHNFLIQWKQILSVHSLAQKLHGKKYYICVIIWQKLILLFLMWKFFGVFFVGYADFNLLNWIFVKRCLLDANGQWSILVLYCFKLNRRVTQITTCNCQSMQRSISKCYSSWRTRLETEICSNRVRLSSQYGPKSLRNLCHEELR